ncbi:MAG: hypothetical protein EA446_04115 [Nitrosopumilus sp.]|nr:MAG: hypothetical protein EA446_04115 [Nitrosopumilus sp.]
MKNFLIDQNCKYLAKDEFQHYFENYDKMYVVGKDLKQREYDEGLGKFCKDKECDLITADSKAYTHFLSQEINTVQISELHYEDEADRPIYRVKIID